MKDTKLPIAVWLGMLPEPIRTKAIKNHLNCSYAYSSDFEVSTLKEAVDFAFSWYRSKEGYGFWDSIYFKSKTQIL